MVERPHHEIELKLRVPPERTAQVRQAIEGRSGAQRLHLQASYVDTPAFDLAAKGMGWRMRREGRKWVQTVKANLSDGGDGMRRLEHNVVVHHRGRPAPDASLHSGHPAGERLAQVLATLQEVPGERFHTDVWRAARTVRVAGGRVEVAFDQGQIVAADRVVPVSEVEVELVSGKPSAVIDAARLWVERHGLWLDSATKAQRGVMLARGLTEAPVARAPVPELTGDMSVDAALREMTRACLVQIMGNSSAVADGTGGHEHVHQARVGIRKLRTVLREFGTYSAAVDPGWSLRLADVFTELGVSRDREVVLEGWLATLDTAGAPRIAPPDEPITDPGAMLRDPAFTLLILDLLGYVHGEPLEADPEHSLTEVVALRLDHLRQRSLEHPKRFVRLPIDEQHEIRKRLKRLRYVAELTQALFAAKKVRRYVGTLEPVQTALGALNDLVVATDLFRSMASTEPRAWFAVGWLSARRDETTRACVVPLREANRAMPYWQHR